jgi:hypothetical protein
MRKKQTRDEKSKKKKTKPIKGKKKKKKKKVEKRQRCLYWRSVVLSLRHVGCCYCCEECKEERRYNTCFSRLCVSAKSVFATT